MKLRQCEIVQEKFIVDMGIKFLNKVVDDYLGWKPKFIIKFKAV